jgi:prepilin-type processing-associated H-X9-DG protein
LLVVISIIGILIALLLPAVQSARAAAQRAQCLNNMKQVGLAMLNHESTLRYFPHGTYNLIGIGSDIPTPAPYSGKQDRRCWMQDILPYLEQQALYGQFETHMKTGASALGFALQPTVVPTLMCPADPLSPKLKTFWGGHGTPTQGFSGNLVVCAGNDFFNPGGLANSTKLNGMFYAISKVRMGQIGDGTSNTAMTSELILSPDTAGHDIRGRYYNSYPGGVLFSTRVPPNTMVPDQITWCSPSPALRAPCTWSDVDVFVSARSYHSGGVNFGLVDGSCRFVSNFVDPLIYKALGSRNGKEVVGGEY